MFLFSDVKNPRNVRVKFIPYFHVVFYILLPLSFLSIASLLPPPTPGTTPTTNHTHNNNTSHAKKTAQTTDLQQQYGHLPAPFQMGAGSRSHAAVFVGAPAEGAKCAGGACAAPAPAPQAPAHKWRVRGPGGVITGTGAENGGGGGGGTDNKLTAAAGGAGGAGGTGPKTKLPSPQVGKEGRETFTPSQFILMKGESLDQSEWKKPSFSVFSTTSYTLSCN